jgi:4'-phosphopantetheinyl transferase
MMNSSSPQIIPDNSLSSVLWQVPPAQLSLSETDIHIWRACLELDELQIQNLRKILSSDEQSRADRFYFERDRTRFIAGHGFLRIILSRYSGIPPERLVFSYGDYGKPTLYGGTEGTLCFNMSHSNGLCLYAVGLNRAVGIDIEFIRAISDAEQIAKSFFSPREYKLLCSLPPEQKDRAFFKGWTCKEAYLKATGEGLSGLERVEVSLDPSEPAALLSIQGNPHMTSRWSVYALTPFPEYAAALVAEGHDWHLNYYRI